MSNSLNAQFRGVLQKTPLSNGAVLVHKIADAQAEQIRDAQSGVDANGEKQQVAEAALAFEQVFDVSRSNVGKAVRLGLRLE